jgi:hypothetical protein
MFWEILFGVCFGILLAVFILSEVSSGFRKTVRFLKLAFISLTLCAIFASGYYFYNEISISLSKPDPKPDYSAMSDKELMRLAGITPQQIQGQTFNVKLPDGTTINGVPIGTTKEQVRAKFEPLGYKFDSPHTTKGDGLITNWRDNISRSALEIDDWVDDAPTDNYKKLDNDK